MFSDLARNKKNIKNKLSFYNGICYSFSGADPGFLERGFICIKGWGFVLLILSHFS